MVTKKNWETPYTETENTEKKTYMENWKYSKNWENLTQKTEKSVFIFLVSSVSVIWWGRGGDGNKDD